MKTYRVLWLSVCVPLGVIGAAVGLVISPAAVAFLFIVVGVVGSLLTFCLVDAYWERGTGGRLRLLAGGALVAGTGVGAFVGYAALLGPGVLLLAAAVLAGSPYAVHAAGRWFRSVRTPSTAQLDALARAFAYANPDSTQFRPPPELRELTDEQLCRRWRASYRSSPATTVVGGEADRGGRGAADVPRRARTTERDGVRGLAGRGPPDGGGSPAVPHRGPHRSSGRRLGRADPRTRLVTAALTAWPVCNRRIR